MECLLVNVRHRKVLCEDELYNAEDPPMKKLFAEHHSAPLQDRSISTPSRSIGERGAELMLSFILATLVVTAIGCAPSDEVFEYTINNEIPESLVQRDRMLGAIVPVGDSVWYYKIVAEKTSAEDIQTEFKKWVQGLRYVEGEPELKTPKDWRRVAPGRMQAAKFEIPNDDTSIEMSVTRLGRGSEWSDDVLRNVNRWRGQMGLDPESSQWGGAETLDIESEDTSETPFWVVLDGQFKTGAPMGRPPMMSGSTPAPEERASPQRQPISLAFDVPEGWSKGKAGGMRLAAFDIKSDEGEAEVTVIEAGGDIRQNLAMWLSQVKPDSEPESAVQELLDGRKEVTVLGKVGMRYQLFGSKEVNKAIDVAVIPIEAGVQLFIKMTGDPNTVRSADEDFTNFLSAITSKDG